jgi:cellulose synthase (UDP-forming)
MSLATGLTFWDAILPGLLIGLVAIAVLPWLNRDHVIARGAIIGACLAIMWRYLFWRIFHTLPPIGFSADFAVGIVFLVVEVLCVTGTTISLIVLTRTRSRTPDADRNMQWLERLPRPPLVDVLICTYNEDEQILERTVIGAQALDYDNYRLWVCDDGRRPWLKELCKRLQCGYLTRAENAHAKAGNINNALQHLASLPQPPDFIAILDADFVVQPKFLRRLLALMKDENVGIVQTPQHFFNPDPIQSNLAIAHIWPDEQRYFFDVLLPSKDAWGGAFCCGTSSLIRVAPLSQIGGIPTDSVTEDYLLTLRLKEAGFVTVYLNEQLSLGLAPEGLKEYVTQRSRWCLGFMQIFRGSNGPLRLGNRLSLLDRVLLIETFLHWSMTFTFRLLCLIVPSIYLLFNVQAVHAHVTEALSYVVPYLVIYTAFITWLTRGRVLPILADLSQLLAATDMVRAVVAGLAKPAGRKFQVTAKGGDRSSKSVQWPMLGNFAGYFAVTAAGILWAYAIDATRPLADASALSLFWSWYNLLILTLACFVAIEERQRRSAERFRAQRTFEVEAMGQVADFRVFDISVSGIAFFGQSPAPRNSAVTVRIGNRPVAGVVVRSSAHSFAIHFTHTQATRAHLIRHVFSGRYRAAVDRVQVGEVALGIVSRLWR